MNLINQEKILAQLKELITDETGLKAEEISVNSHFEDDLNLDNFELADLLVSVEEKFGIELDEDIVENLNTVQDLVHAIEDNL